MPRKAREQSETGIYHIMLRGINRQQIFIDAEDSKVFLNTLAEYKPLCGYKLLAYCLMGNHVHLLMKFEGEAIATSFRRICGKYVYWYNTKYRRVGHLFQDRYRSEPVNDEKYLFGVLAYIHNNPIKAGLCRKPEAYADSSYRAYLAGSAFVDCDEILKMITVEQFIELHFRDDLPECMEMPEQQAMRYTDEAAKNLIQKVIGTDSLQQLDAENRNRYIQKLLEKGLSIRQLSRLLGVPVSLIRQSKAH